MNVGAVLLALVANPAVARDHSFGRFPAPFNQALPNFDLNPKIVPQQLGMSGGAQRAAVDDAWQSRRMT